MSKTALRGITLLEMLIVLAIAGMAMALSLQILQQYQRAQSAAIRHERAGREFALTEQWLRSAIQGLAPTKDGPFQGDKEQWSGTTLLPISTQAGVPTRHRWAISNTGQDGFSLTLSEAGTPLELSVRPSDSLRFHYMDELGTLHDRWPPAKGNSPQLPTAVILEIGQDVNRPRLVVAAVSGAKDTRSEFIEFDQDW